MVRITDLVSQCCKLLGASSLELLRDPRSVVVAASILRILSVMKVVSRSTPFAGHLPQIAVMDCAADGSVWFPDELVLQFFSYLPPKPCTCT